MNVTTVCQVVGNMNVYVRACARARLAPSVSLWARELVLMPPGVSLCSYNNTIISPHLTLYRNDNA